MSLSTIRLPYGSDTVAFDFSRPPEVWNITDPEVRITPELFRERVAAFLDQSSPDLSRPVIIVGDKTRLCGYPRYLPVLIDALVAGGMDESQLKIFIAYGTHAPQSEDQSRRAYGESYHRGRWVHHRCDDQARFVDLGRTADGTPVRLPAAVTGASARITFGAISHHYFAGYGGGRKLIFPGLGERKAIYANHGLFLDRDHRCLSTGCQPGKIAGNPLAEDLDSIEAFCPAHMAVHGILDSYGQVCDLLVGHGATHFRSACDCHARHCEVAGADYDMVLASSGGFPKDINFIQSHKAIHNAAAFVRDGGWLIVLAQCRDGVGSETFLPWFKMGSWDAAFGRLAAEYVGNGGTALSMMTKTKRIRIDLITDLKDEILDTIGVGRLTKAAAEATVKTFHGRIGILPNAGMIVRRDEGNPSR